MPKVLIKFTLAVTLGWPPGGAPETPELIAAFAYFTRSAARFDSQAHPVPHYFHKCNLTNTKKAHHPG